tara:strand:- start:59 stop:1171 length:1113 start_codon:yes stop_codon:yes gene_type:complete
MKSFTKFIVIFIFISSVGYGQNNDWITLTTPQSGILGAPVDKVKNGDINFDFGIKYDKNPAIETRESAESKIEYENKFRNFTSKYFSSDKTSIQKITAYNLKVRILAQDAIDNLQIGGKFIYETVAADSVYMTISAKKEFSADISKAIKDLSAAITNPKTTEIVEKVAPFLDSISYTRNDSIFYDVKIKNPNVYYKIKLIKLKKNGNPCNCDWESNCFLIFTEDPGKPGPEPRTKLSYDNTGVNSRTINRYPEFCGKDIKGWYYYLKLEKENDELQLWVWGTNTNVNSSEEQKKEVPFKVINGKKQWRLDRFYLDRSTKKGRIKNAYIEVSARQIDENSIEIIHFVEQGNSTRYLTTLKYPEFKGKYVKK